MVESLYLLEGAAYDRLAPLIREYEDALIRTYCPVDGSPSPGEETPEAIRVRLRKATVAEGRAGLSISEDLSAAMKTTMLRVKREQPSTYGIIRPLYQSIGLRGSEAGVLAHRLMPWCTGDIEVLIRFYTEAAAADEGIVALPVE